MTLFDEFDMVRATRDLSLAIREGCRGTVVMVFVEPGEVPELLVAFLEGLSDDQLTRSVVCAKVGELSAHAQDGQ